MEISSDTGIRYLRKFRECLEKLVVFVEENFIYIRNCRKIVKLLIYFDLKYADFIKDEARNVENTHTQTHI